MQNNYSLPSSDRRHLADYAMAFDLVAKIAGVTTEQKVIEMIFEFFAALCAPAELVYLPFRDGKPGEIMLRPEASGKIDPLKERLMKLRGAYMLSDSEKGFILRIQLEEDMLGIFSVDRIMFPEHLQHYLNLGIHLASSIALAVTNARYFERLQIEITERTKTEERIIHSNLVLAGINRVFREVLSHRTEEELGEACLRVAEEITGSRFGFIGEIGPDGLLHDIAISNPGWELCTLYDRKGRRRPPNNFHIHGIYGKVLSEGKGYFINEPASHPDSVGLPSGHPPLTAFLGVPLIRDGSVIGMIAMGNRENGYTDSQLEMLNTLAPSIVEAFQRKRAEDALRKANKELAVTNKELEGFSYSVSHDLRAPLRSMLGFSDMLFQRYSDKLDEKGKKFLTFVANGAQKMDQIVDSLLRLSRIGRQDLHREDADLSKIAQSVAAVLCGVQQECRDAITIKQGIRGYVDPRLVEVALSNLLSNALKFTSKTVGPHVEFGSVEQEGKTVYYVSDNGAGFDQRFADRLFLPFHRLHSDQEFPGTGIGLAIVEKVISRHGGKIWAEGKTNEGATFFFTLL